MGRQNGLEMASVIFEQSLMNLRDQFPIFRHHRELVYLDSAATAHKPECVIEALTRFYTQEYATVHRAVYQGAVRATERYHGAREIIQKFINAKSSDEIVFTRGTTDAINLVARTFPFKAGDEILVSEIEHHSNLVPWQMIAKEKGLILKKFSLKEPLPISSATRFIAVAHISNVTGEIVPIQKIIGEAHRKGALVLIDGAQAAPHQKIDVQALDADFYAFSGHKCYGPTGIGVLYGKLEHLLTMAPWQGGGDMVQRVDPFDSSYQEPPLRFEAGTPIIGSAIGFGAALEFLQSVGLDRIARHEEGLAKTAAEQLKTISGLRILGNALERGPLLTFTIEGIHPLDLGSLLDAKNIAIRTGNLCAQPLLRQFGCETAARVSFGMYNTLDEVGRFIEAVQKSVQFLRH